jgi:hypothetical protein
MSAKPLCIDLYAGMGGWTDGFLAHGYDVAGFDLVRHKEYKGMLAIQDVRTLDGARFKRAAVIVASPPCEEFSRHSMPWTRRRNPPPPDLSCALAAFRIAREAGVSIILENVRAAQQWLGRANGHIGPYYLWGDGVPALLAQADARTKESFSSARRDLRARIPFGLSEWVARCYKGR